MRMPIVLLFLGLSLLVSPTAKALHLGGYRNGRRKQGFGAKQGVASPLLQEATAPAAPAVQDLEKWSETFLFRKSHDEMKDCRPVQATCENPKDIWGDHLPAMHWSQQAVLVNFETAAINYPGDFPMHECGLEKTADFGSRELSYMVTSDDDDECVLIAFLYNLGMNPRTYTYDVAENSAEGVYGAASETTQLRQPRTTQSEGYAALMGPAGITAGVSQKKQSIGVREPGQAMEDPDLPTEMLNRLAYADQHLEVLYTQHDKLLEMFEQHIKKHLTPRKQGGKDSSRKSAPNRQWSAPSHLVLMVIQEDGGNASNGESTGGNCCATISALNAFVCAIKARTTGLAQHFKSLLLVTESAEVQKKLASQGYPALLLDSFVEVRASYGKGEGSPSDSAQEASASASANASARDASRQWVRMVALNLALDAGYNVLLQSPCVLWQEDPWPYLDDDTALSTAKADAKLRDGVGGVMEGGSSARFDVTVMDVGEAGRRAVHAPFHASTDFVFVRSNSWTNWFIFKVVGSLDLMLLWQHNSDAKLVSGLKPVRAAQCVFNCFLGDYHGFGVTVRVLPTAIAAAVGAGAGAGAVVLEKDTKALLKSYLAGGTCAKAPAPSSSSSSSSAAAAAAAVLKSPCRSMHIACLDSIAGQSPYRSAWPDNYPWPPGGSRVPEGGKTSFYLLDFSGKNRSHLSQCKSVTRVIYKQNWRSDNLDGCLAILRTKGSNIGGDMMYHHKFQHQGTKLKPDYFWFDEDHRKPMTVKSFSNRKTHAGKSMSKMQVVLPEKTKLIGQLRAVLDALPPRLVKPAHRNTTGDGWSGLESRRGEYHNNFPPYDLSSSDGGGGVSGNTARKVVVLFAVNEGHMPLFLNWVCSCRYHGIDTSNVLLLAASKRMADYVNGQGVKAYFHPGLGQFTAGAAGAYGDKQFTEMMWLKVVAVWLTLECGYDVLFQDADIVWMRDPQPDLVRGAMSYHTQWMDDISRAVRFSPFFANTGFLYLKYSQHAVLLWRSLAWSYNMVHAWSSQQHALNHWLGKMHALGLGVRLVPQQLYPSGNKVHQVEIMKLYTDGEWQPLLFHVCFTLNMKEKMDLMNKYKLVFLDEKKVPWDHSTAATKILEAPDKYPLVCKANKSGM